MRAPFQILAIPYKYENGLPIVLSHEHTELVWLPYKEARERLQWDSNKTALYELNRILSKQHEK